MQLIYESEDITNAVEIRKADLIDNAGGELDSIDLILNDPKGLWSQWKPEKNHTIQIKESGFDSGIMYTDELGQQRGLISIKALPVKQEAKTPNIKSWDNVRFLGLVREIASKHSLTLQTYGVQDQLYTRVDQYEQADFEFLSRRCLLESCALKITDGKLIVYGEQYMESQTAVKSLTPDDIDGDFLFKNKSNQIFGACKVSHKGVQYEFKAPGAYGPTLKAFDIALGSLGEAERTSKGLLRAKNKFEQTFSGVIRLEPGIASGNVLALNNFGLADGNYFAYQIIHKLVQKRTIAKLRKPLEGY
ncbi:phage late control D family protein [Desulfosporosinus fructosivorans]|uniref:Phage late control D family protein n=1 Tax=Desulfosporosinus fructosivorans TaxID=2018669 RepID=A0A4Z0R1J7_9FIRM|nr:phage late control D family protein [Desulfosporosinus fructosivorans]TGE36891.1 phage late control D family protein [Desulfosporosinus fructosivorans]